MLGPADDFLIHQTAEPVRYAATSDRRFYDRHFMTGHACSDALFFMIGIGCYPNLGVIDAFASIACGDTQTTTRASRELGHDRLNTRDIGPFTVEVLEGLRRLRVVCERSDEAVALDLTWEGAVPAFEEPPLFNRTLGRVMEQGTRFIQTGCWAGWIEVDGRRFDLDPGSAWGARDRSWGVRSIGLEREPRGLLQAKREQAPRTSLWMWSPMQFNDYSVHFSIGEFASGKRDIEVVRRTESFANGGEIRMLEGAEHDLKFDLESREMLAGSQVSFVEPGGESRTVTLSPLRRAYLRGGTGYGGPDPWRHGTYMGEAWASSVSYDLTDTAITSRIGPTHVLCRMDMDNGEVGYGTFETQVFGAYPRYGFNA